jgi:hypothetical protein
MKSAHFRARGFVCASPAFALAISLFLSNPFPCLAQDQEPTQDIVSTLNNLSDKTLNAIDNKYTFLDKLIQKQTEKMLKRMQKKEGALQKAMQGKDSLQAKLLFTKAQQDYQKLLTQLQSPVDKDIANPLRTYIPVIDSIQTAMRFLSLMNSQQIPGMPLDKLQKVQLINQQLQQLQARLQSATEIQQYVAQREQAIKNAFNGLGITQRIQGVNKEAYYYQQQVVEYKNMLHDPKKAEEKALEVVSRTAAYQNFMQKHSYLSQLFGLPPNYGSPESLNGLQTKSQIEGLIGQKLGSANNGGSGPTNSSGDFLNQQMGAAQQNLSKLQDKAMILGNGGGNSSSMVMPDFKPNSQRTKSFLTRLEYGFNIQTQKTNTILPTTSSIALILGYKINDNSTAGIGVSYNVGLGNGINHIQFSSQGVGLRSYLDIKAKGSLWISGGFEYNYLQAFENLQQIRNLDIWQKSALLGLTKKLKITKNKTCNLQLLYDFLYKDHTPASQPLLFRMGYSF